MIRVYKSKAFKKWADKEGLPNTQLCKAVDEMQRGLLDADLGSGVVKKRVAISGRGKRGSFRTIVAYRMAFRAFFIYGFAKNSRANISKSELLALKRLAGELMAYEPRQLKLAIFNGALFEVECNE